MNIVLLQSRLELNQIDFLLQEFPQYLFLSLSENTYKNLTPEQWSRVEIIYGSRLTVEDLRLAHQLHWFHSTQTHLNRVCLEDIEKRGNILVTNTLDENTCQAGEYVLAGVLAFAKNLFHWYDVNQNPSVVWDSKWRDSMWSLKNRLWLQIGLARIGTEVTRRARQMEMRVWGVQDKKTFHPYCHQTFSQKQMHALLPEADVVCLTLSRGKECGDLFTAEELSLMKPDSILVIVGSSKLVDEAALAAAARSGKFRGILFDASYQNPFSLQSPLWGLPNMLITPEVSPRPKSMEGQSFRIFLFNMRQYLHGNFKEMHNLITQVASRWRI